MIAAQEVTSARSKNGEIAILSDQDDVSFYPVQLMLLGRPMFLLWRTGTNDEYLSDLGALLTWPDLGRLDAYCAANGMPPNQSESLLKLNLDELREFIDCKRELTPDKVVDFWNFFIDIEFTHRNSQFSQLDENLRDLYGKTFAMTSSGEVVGLEPIPYLDGEIAQLQALMGSGLSMVLTLIEGRSSNR